MRSFMYCEDHPEGVCFDDSDLGDLGNEWVDTPAKLGVTKEVAPVELPPETKKKGEKK